MNPDRLKACPTACAFATIARLQKQAGARSVAVEPQAKRFYVSGRVQGVGFRFFAERTAGNLGIGGYVRNLYDGRVEVYATGSLEQLDALRNALQRGPRMAAVDRLDEENADLLRKYANGFFIESDQ
jgi:acylphosphatase